MATERELNKRIKSIKNISQVTSALAAVSASKASRAQKQVEATRNYAEKAFEILQNLASQPGVGQSMHPLLHCRDDIKNTGFIMITGDRGLCGSYNSNMVAYAQQFLAKLETPAQLITVGRKGQDLMIRRGYDVIATFDGLPDPPTLLDLTPVAQLATEEYMIGTFDQVFIAYTDYINLVTRQPAIKQLLPLRPLDYKGWAVSELISGADFAGASGRTYTYEPDPVTLLDTVVPRFTQLQVFQSYLESLASEHSARMVAMNNATDNAAELVEILTLDRNKARQTSITNEILDIVGGAEALASG
jgi:F-type H+-transporting ATPase subunit gamma